MLRRPSVAASRRPRVCIVRQSDVYEQQIRREAEALVAAGFEVEVLCMRHPDRPRRTVMGDVLIIGLPTSRRKGSKARYIVDYASFFVVTAATLAGRHLRRRYAVIQVNTMPDVLVFAALLPKLLGARVIAYMHEPSPELAETLYGSGSTLRDGLIRALGLVEQAALRFADQSITVTEQLRQRYVERGASAEKITVVLNGVAAETMVGAGSSSVLAQPDEFTVVCHGSIEERYGQDTILDAAALLRDKLPSLRIIVTGRGSWVDTMVRRIDELRLADVVRFEGWVDFGRLNEILRSAAVGIVAQKGSAYSHLVQTNKMVDFWIHGIPVIASRLDAVAEMYDDSVIEYFVPGDAGSLAAAVLHVHDDPARRAELARNGRIAQDRNGWATQRTTYLGVYDRVMAGSEDQLARRLA